MAIRLKENSPDEQQRVRISANEECIVRRFYYTIITGGDEIALVDLSKSITPSERRLLSGQEGRIRSLRMFMNKHGHVFNLSRDSGPKGREVVRPIVKIEFCKVFDSKQGCNDNLCPNLHICRHFVKGKCTFGLKCKKPHHFDDPHTKAVLRSHYLDRLDRSQLKEFLCRNVQFAIEDSIDEANLPKQLEICKYYNVAIGCSREDLCPFLHVCRFYAEDGTCKFGQKCIRKHDCFNEHAQMLLRRYKISEKDVFLFLRKRGIQGRHAEEKPSQLFLNSSNLSPKERGYRALPIDWYRAFTGNSFAHSILSVIGGNRIENVICTEAFTGHCKAVYCAKMHKMMPFCWQYTLDHKKWFDVSRKENVKIEAMFAKPEVEDVCVHLDDNQQFLFKFAESVGILVNNASSKGPAPVVIQIRRLSTPPSITKPEVSDFNTIWFWHFLEDGNTWQAYSIPGIEKAFSALREDSFQFVWDGTSYVVDFKSMSKENKLSGKKTPVRRRPALFDVHMLYKRDDDDVELEKSFFPGYWKTDALMGISGGNFGQCALLPLDPYSKEYLKTFYDFGSRMGFESIVNILAVANPRLWMTYTMARDNLIETKSHKVEEMSLYCAVSWDDAEKISKYGFENDNEQGLERFLFAKDARLANRYNKATSAGFLVTFLCRVLTDSCVTKRLETNDVIVNKSSPAKSFPAYCVLDGDHVFPEFIVLSKCDKKSMHKNDIFSM